MYSFEDDNFLLELPNEVHWIFTPAIIKVTKKDTTSLGVVRVTVENNSQGKSLVESRELGTNGVAMFDVSRMMQIAFGDVGLLPPDQGTMNYFDARYHISLQFVGVSGMVTIAEHDVLGIWGSSFYNEPKRAENLTWFTKYPFSFSFVGQVGAPYVQLHISSDSGSSAITTSSGALVKFPVYTTRISGNLLADVDSIRLSSYQVTSPENDTLTGAPIYVNIRKDCSTNGVYLRWVDHWGYICYYLFEEIGQEVAYESESWNRYDTMRTDSSELVLMNDMYLLNDAMRTKRSFSSTKTRSLGVKLIDEEQHTFLMSILSSPIVEVFDGYDGYSLDSLQDMPAEEIVEAIPKWHRVQVVASKVEKGRKPLNDFSVVIQEPTLEYQQL